MKTTILSAGCVAFVTLTGLAGTAAAKDAHDTSYDLVLDDVALRPGVTGDLHIRVLENDRHPCHGNGHTMLAIHGATGAASNWEPLAETLFSAHGHGKPVCRIAAVDLPGHGASSLPQGMLFGDLGLHDYVTAVLASFAGLEQRGIRPTTILGHSQGGMVVQLVQQELESSGSSLRDALGVDHAVLFASVGPRALPWAFVSGGTAGAVLAPFVSFDAVLGVHFYMPPALWPLLVFSTPDGQIVASAPSPAEIAAAGYDSPEPIAALSELLGTPPLERPYVAPSAFAESLDARRRRVRERRDHPPLGERGSLRVPHRGRRIVRLHGGAGCGRGARGHRLQPRRGPRRDRGPRGAALTRGSWRC